MKFNDYELIYLYNEGNEKIADFILRKYKPLIEKIIYDLHINPLDKEDFLQEGLMVVYNLLKQYNDDKGLFYSYCKICIERKFYALLNRRKDVSYVLFPIEELPKLKQDYLIYNKEYESWEFQKILDIKSDSIKKYAKDNNMSVKQVYNYIEKLKKRIKMRSSN